MGLLLIVGAIILIIMGILGLFHSLSWAYVKIWRAILEIVIGVFVLIFGILLEFFPY